MENLFVISIFSSVIILIILAIMPLIDKYLSAGWKYYVWLIISVRLILPFRVEIPNAPINLPSAGTGTFVIRADSESNKSGLIEYYSDDSYKERAAYSPSPIDYAPLFTTGDIIFYTWLIGAIVFFLAHIINYFRFKTKICSSISKQNGYYVSSMIHSPLMIGFFKPLIILPERSYTQTELEVILKHENTHRKRHDTWYKLLLVIVNAVHWFNPVIYVMIRRAVRDLEYSCDDIVIRGTDTEYRKEYAMAILKSMKER